MTVNKFGIMRTFEAMFESKMELNSAIKKGNTVF